MSPIALGYMSIIDTNIGVKMANIVAVMGTRERIASIYAGNTTYIDQCQGANPQRVSTEIIIEINQLYSGRIASNPFIASNRRYMVFPLRDHFSSKMNFETKK